MTRSTQPIEVRHIGISERAYVPLQQLRLRLISQGKDVITDPNPEYIITNLYDFISRISGEHETWMKEIYYNEKVPTAAKYTTWDLLADEFIWTNRHTRYRVQFCPETEGDEI